MENNSLNREPWCQFWYVASIPKGRYPDSKVHGANMGPTWVLSTPDGPMLAPWTLLSGKCRCLFLWGKHERDPNIVATRGSLSMSMDLKLQTGRMFTDTFFWLGIFLKVFFGNVRWKEQFVTHMSSPFKYLYMYDPRSKWDEVSIQW